MTTPTFILAALQASLLRPVILAAVAWLLLRVFRVRHPGAEHAVWTGVLLAMLVLPGLSVLAPHWALPVLPRRPIAAAAMSQAAAAPVASRADAAPPLETPAIAAVDLDAAASATIAAAIPPSGATARPAPPRTSPVLLVVLSVYLAGLLIMAGYRLMGWVLLRRLIARSRPIRGRSVRESAEILTPAAAAILRPVVLLPAGWRGWDALTRRTVQAHEFAHLRRGDGMVLALGRLAKTVYWFHPLAWWLSRRTTELADQACDLAALKQAGDVDAYARILLNFASIVQRAGRRAAAPGLAMASGSNLSHRINRAFELAPGLTAAGSRSARRLPRFALPLACLALPLVALAATVTLGARSARPAPQAVRTSAILPAPKPSPKPEPSVPKAEAPSPAPPAAAPTFTAASVTPAKDEVDYEGTEGPTFEDGVLSFRGMPPVRLLGYAYGTNFVQGNPLWVDDTHAYDVTALAPAGATQLELQAMMRNLLADRFQLKAHTEDVMVSGYALTLSGGPRTGLHKSDSSQGTCFRVNLQQPESAANPVECKGVTMGDLAEILRMIAPGYIPNKWVVDKTGLDGRFDMSLHWRAVNQLHHPGDAGYNAAEDVTVFQALEQQIGLRLEAGDVPKPAVVVDAINLVAQPNPPGTAQRLPAQPAAFASATIALGTPGGNASRIATITGRVNRNNQTLAVLISNAYGLDSLNPPVGAPDWVQTDTYTIQAQTPPGGSIRTGIQDLLEKRFHLAAHVETRPVEVWALKRVAAGTLPPLPTNGGFNTYGVEDQKDGTSLADCSNITMDEFGDWVLHDYDQLDNYVGKVRVVNLTGLTGHYDFKFTFKTDATAADGPNPATGLMGHKVSLFQALREQLGLELTKQMYPEKVLVIDHIDRTPTPN